MAGLAGRAPWWVIGLASGLALAASAVREATGLLNAGVEVPELREAWRRLELRASARRVSCYAVDWSRLGATGLDDCWSWNRGWTTVVIGLSAAADGPRGLVRFVGAEQDQEAPGYLRSLSGQQSAAFMATLPGPVSVHALPVDDRGRDIASAEALAGMVVPIGPNGQILGALSGQPQHTLALPLFDPSRFHTRRRTVDIRASLPVAQQIILRSMVVGATVEI
ncbi:hypothetical protein ACFWXT_29940, partial [Bacillus cereus]|uniref:hypothetical protein n=1 Tax=Bacillus cereus TaxID=1396 RepID=UPI003670EFDD